ncbi:flagellar assembly protein FliH [Ramlibacter tataouinensis]|uniref:flagellar assembly protein FliH n=1 Tax=Ramlibacter tataouinensis TaxID=94132 RepID=UPI0022F40097|nr:flagellar assembly protein FliH [Ramlibacter tataouinensis]WBY00616.1 flagellar assembly protein FliH [Ramlibacter tataouinensis]
MSSSDAPTAAAPAVTLTAWQRWEMASFAGPDRQAVPAPPPPPKPAPAPVLTPLEPVRRFDEAELERLREAARQAGAAEGRTQGLAQGRLEGRAAGLEEMRQEAAQLLALAQALPAALRIAERELAEGVLGLALDLGRQLAGTALKTDPDCVLAVVRDLLASAPELSGSPRLLLHPDDAALVREQLGEELREAGWSLQADAAVTRGGCRVKSAVGELDASVETRWQRVEAALTCRLPDRERCAA